MPNPQALHVRCARSRRRFPIQIPEGGGGEGVILGGVGVTTTTQSRGKNGIYILFLGLDGWLWLC